MKTMNDTTNRVEIDMRGKWIRGGLALVVAAGLAGCGAAAADGTDEGSEGSEFVRVINVEVQTLAARPFAEVIRLTGVARANQDVEVSAEESGVIREIFVEKGSSVREAQALARIDGEILEAQVAQARAAAELAEETWTRRKRLWEEDRVGSEIAYLEARYAAEQTAASLRALEERLERTTVRAPFAGVLDQRMIEVGSMVSPGQALFRVVDLSPMKVVAGVPERYAADVRPGTETTVHFDVLPGDAFEGSISYVGATVDARNRTFPVELRMANPGGLVKPEMVANLEVERRTLEEAVVVPQDALVRVEDGYVVFVVREEGGVSVAERRRVELGPRQRDEVVIMAGVSEGDRLVVVGQKSVADGDRVNVVGTGPQG